MEIYRPFNPITMEKYKMPYLFIFTDEELTELWSAYIRIAGVMRKFQDRTKIAVLDDEVRAGAHFRAREIEAECRRREGLPPKPDA